MDKLDAFARDHIAQAVDVLADHERVLGRQRQRNVFRAATFQFAHLAAAFRRHHGLLASQHQRLGHIDGAALDPAAAHVQRRQNLQHDGQSPRGLDAAVRLVAHRSGRGARLGAVVHFAYKLVP